MYAIAAQHKVITLVLRGTSKSAPFTERIVCLPTISGFNPYMTIIHPNLIYFVSFHYNLLMIKVFFPTFNDNIFIL